MRTITCSCGNKFEARHNREKYCPDCKPERKQAWNRAYREKRHDAQLGAVLQRETYQPDRLDMLAAAVIGRAYRDATYQYDNITREHINPQLRCEAKGWLDDCADDWAACLGVEIEIPRVG